MADLTKGEGGEPQDPKGGETQVQDPQAGQQPQDPKQGEAGQAQDPGAGEGDTVRRHQYDRDIQRRDQTIADLQRQLKELNDDKAASGDQTAQLRKEMDELKQQLADEKSNAALAAGLTAVGFVLLKVAECVVCFRTIIFCSAAIRPVRPAKTFSKPNRQYQASALTYSFMGSRS